MAKNSVYKVKWRRRRENKTNYRQRKALLSSGKPRAVVRFTNSKVIVQLVGYQYTGDTVLATSTSTELKGVGWTKGLVNTPAAYLTGFHAAKRAAVAGITEAVLDIGLSTPSKGCRAFAVLKGLQDGGLDIPSGDGIFPSEERIKGEHMGEDIPGLFEKVFTKLQEDDA